MRTKYCAAAFLTLICTTTSLPAHPGHSHRRSPPAGGQSQPRASENAASTGVPEIVLPRQAVTFLLDETADDAVADLSLLNALPLLLAQADREATVSRNQLPEMARAFEAFVKSQAVKTRFDNRYLYVESNGIPDHPMMIGITAWQQQVPIPQPYTGDNSWQIPLHPVPAKNPRSANGAFLRGAIAVAVNGIPIFNPLNNRGDDAYLFGELDEYGGHCGRADDYHYHIAPVHLEKIVGQGKPIAYALDGYPIYGYEEPDGSPVKSLDPFNGHKDADGNYHYHATKKYPYLNGGFYGEVTERDGQVDPQPRAEPLRPALPPLRGAKIVDFRQTKPNQYLLTYEVSGRKGTVSYVLAADGSAEFTFVDPAGRTTRESYSRNRRGAGRKNAPPPRDGQQPNGKKKARPAESEAPASSRRPAAKGTSFNVSSASVNDRGMLSVDCTCDGKRESPAVSWKNAPAGTAAFAVSLWHTAPDQEKSYWLVYNIPADTTGLSQNGKPKGVVGLNDRRKAEFDPMCSKGPGVKTYHLTVYALSRTIDLPPDKAARANLLNAIKDNTLAESTLDFQYERKSQN